MSSHICFVVESQTPYCYEFVEILAYPSGFKYRSRWQEKWVASSIRKDIAQLEGRRVLILLRDRPKGIVIPVRWGRIHAVRRIGPIFWFEYELCDLVAFDDAPRTRGAQLEAFNEDFTRHHSGSVRDPDLDLDHYVFESDVGTRLSLIQSDDLKNWGHVVTVLGSVEILEGVEFLKIVEVSTLQGELARVVDGQYQLRPGKVYALSLLQYIPRSGDSVYEPHDLTINTASEHLRVLVGRRRAVGKYDMLRFVVQLRDIDPNDRTFIQIERAAMSSVGTPPQTLYLPIVVGPARRTQRFARIVLGAVALALVFAANYLPLGPADPELIEKISIVAFIVTVVGVRRLVGSGWRGMW